MPLKKRLSILLLPLFISGCYSYRLFPKEYRDFKTPAPTETVYVVNPELKNEFSILEYAGIYNITTDSACATKIRLSKIHKRVVCGTALPVWLFLLGQLPIYMPDGSSYSFEEIRNSESRKISFELKVWQRYWFWDIFSRKKNFSKEAGKALAANYYAVGQTVTPKP